MQPDAELHLARPWHYGCVIIGSLANVPELGDRPIAASADAVAFRVRHAQHIDADRFEGDWDWATAAIELRVFYGKTLSANRSCSVPRSTSTTTGSVWAITTLS